MQLWKMVDIGGYAAGFMISELFLDPMAKNLTDRTNPDFIQEGWDNVKERYRTINSGYQSINLELLDDMFPLEILTAIRDEIFPEMGECYATLDGMLQPYLQDPSADAQPILEQIDKCKEIVRRAREKGREFGQHPKYRMYRSLIEEGDRIFVGDQGYVREDLLTLEEFSKRDPDPTYNNFFLYFTTTFPGSVMRKISFFQKFQQEHSELERELTEGIMGLGRPHDIHEALKPFDRRLHQAYTIMRGYGASNMDLFA